MTGYEQAQLAEHALANARFTTASGYARTNCPFCIDAVGKDDKKQCLGISVATGFYRCWRCGTRGRIDLGEATQAPAPLPDRPPEIQPPEGFMALCEEPARSALCADEARAYLRGRGLVDEGAWAVAHLGCCVTGSYAGRVVVPVLSPGGEWWGWVTRVWVPKPEPGIRTYKNAPGMMLGVTGGLYNQAALATETDAPVLVVEGAMDTLAVGLADAAAALGSVTKAQRATLLEARRPVVFVPDGDAWQDGEMNALHLRFEGRRAGYLRLPPRTDPDQVPREWLFEEARRCLD